MLPGLMVKKNRNLCKIFSFRDYRNLKTKNGKLKPPSGSYTKSIRPRPIP